MQDNPYVKLVDIMSNTARDVLPVSFRRGRVIRSAPLVVDVSGARQTAEFLEKNALLEELSPGDSVLLVPIDDEQRYIILCKVVDA